MSSEIFPTLISPNWKLTRTPTWSTLAHTSSSGDRRRVPLRAKPLWRWTLKNAVLQSADTVADLQTIQNFFNARAGQLDSFLWLDPEPGSITLDPDTSAVLGSYWPVAFTVDSVDFERFSYQLWQAGTVSFTQIALNTDELGDLSGAGTLTHGPITTATLYTLTSHTPSSSGPGAGASTHEAWGELGLFEVEDHFNSGSAWSLRTDSTLLDTHWLDGPTVANLQGLTVSFVMEGDVPDELLIYDVYIDVTYLDSTTARWRPTLWQSTTSSLISDPLSVVLGGASAIDGDPSTHATINLVATSGTAISRALQVKLFKVSA